MVEAHRLCVQQCARVVSWVVQAQPGRFVRRAGERGGVALAEAEFCEAGDALEDLLRNRFVEPVVDAAADEAVAQLFHLQAGAMAVHGAPEAVRLACGVAGDLHDDA